MLADLPVAAVKTGMLADAGIVAVVADLASAGRLPTGGGPGDGLLQRRPAPRARRRAGLPSALFPHAAVVTPNVHEAGVLLDRPIGTLADQHEAARALGAHRCGRRRGDRGPRGRRDRTGGRRRGLGRQRAPMSCGPPDSVEQPRHRLHLRLRGAAGMAEGRRRPGRCRRRRTTCPRFSAGGRPGSSVTATAPSTTPQGVTDELHTGRRSTASPFLTAWSHATRHPFLEAVRDGTLHSSRAFEAWLVQDYRFVVRLARVPGAAARQGTAPGRRQSSPAVPWRWSTTRLV